MNIIINESSYETKIKKHIEEVRNKLKENHNHTFADDEVVLFVLRYYLINQELNETLKVPIKKEAIHEATFSNQKDF